MDPIGGETQIRSMEVLKEGGTLISIVGLTREGRNPKRNIIVTSTLVQPNSEQLGKIGDLMEQGLIRAEPGRKKNAGQHSRGERLQR